MATIVLHYKSGKRFILLGTGFGAYKSSRPSFLGGSLFPREEEGKLPMAAVCDRSGLIEWFYTDELVVEEVDGQKVAEMARISSFNE